MSPTDKSMTIDVFLLQVRVEKEKVIIRANKQVKHSVILMCEV